jgi:hypothetical protein
MLKKAQPRLLTATPAGVFNRMFPGCTTSCRLRMCCWRAAQTRDLVSTRAYRAATVRESEPRSLFLQPAREST